jgi:hypothetical protein
MKRAFGFGLAAVVMMVATAISAQGLGMTGTATEAPSRSKALKAFDERRAGMLSRAAAVAAPPLQLQSLGGKILFDGKRFDRDLALQVAGARELLDWGNCSYRIRDDGTPVSLFWPTKLPSAKKYACLYLGFEENNAYEEYYLTDLPCGESQPRFCFGGYLIGTKRVSMIRQNAAPDAARHLQIDSVIRAKAYPSGAPSGSPATGGVSSRLGPRTSQEWDAVYRIEQWHNFSAYGHLWGYTIEDGNGSIVEGPVEDATYFPVAYSSSGGSQTCSTIGNGVTAVGAGVTAAAAGFIVASGTGAGALAGGILGSPTGPEGVLAGAGLGGTLGAGFAAFPAGVATGVGGVTAWASGTVAETLCNAVTAPPVNPQPPTALPGLPPHLIDRLIQFRETSCMRCEG